MMIRVMTFTMLLIVLGEQGLAQTMAQPAPTVRTIFDYKGELALTDEQERRMRQILVDLNKELQVERAKLTILSYDLEELIRKEADLEQIKRTLQQEAELRVNIAYADLAAGRQINGTLTHDQLTRWRDIQSSARQAWSQHSFDSAGSSHAEINTEKLDKKETVSAKLKKK